VRILQLVSKLRVVCPGNSFCIYCGKATVGRLFNGLDIVAGALLRETGQHCPNEWLLV
jgi:hypothetical protein